MLRYQSIFEWSPNAFVFYCQITRALIVLEGIALSGDPTFDLFSSSYPYAIKRAANLFGVADLSQIATEAVKARYQMQKKHPHANL